MPLVLLPWLPKTLSLPGVLLNLELFRSFRQRTLSFPVSSPDNDEVYVWNFLLYRPRGGRPCPPSSARRCTERCVGDHILSIPPEKLTAMPLLRLRCSELCAHSGASRECVLHRGTLPIHAEGFRRRRLARLVVWSFPADRRPRGCSRPLVGGDPW
jgi:hypothetical protein